MAADLRLMGHGSRYICEAGAVASPNVACSCNSQEQENSTHEEEPDVPRISFPVRPGTEL